MPEEKEKLNCCRCKDPNLEFLLSCSGCGIEMCNYCFVDMFIKENGSCLFCKGLLIEN